MKSAEIFRRAVMAGSILGAGIGAVDMATNADIQKLNAERSAISEFYGVSTTCARDACVTSVEGNNAPEQDAEILAKWRQEIRDLDNNPLNQAATTKESVDGGLFALGLNIAGIGAYAELTKDEEKET